MPGQPDRRSAFAAFVWRHHTASHDRVVYPHSQEGGASSLTAHPVRMHRTLAFVVVAVATAVPAMLPREVHDPASGFTALVYEPPNPQGPMPLLLYLHGAGESGMRVRELISEGATGTPPVELENGRALSVLARRFVTVAPQTSHGWAAEEVGRLLDFLLDAKGAHGLALDPQRCYVTGHSMGGAGAIAAGTLRRFAAVVPVAPAGSVPPRELLGVPVWAFHGKNDVVVPYSYSEHLITRLRSLGANESDARLTLYEQAPAPVGWPDYDGHASTILAYSTLELYKWLLEQRCHTCSGSRVADGVEQG